MLIVNMSVLSHYSLIRLSYSLSLIFYIATIPKGLFIQSALLTQENKNGLLYTPLTDYQWVYDNDLLSFDLSVIVIDMFL